jgi:hypothetical protein
MLIPVKCNATVFLYDEFKVQENTRGKLNEQEVGIVFPTLSVKVAFLSKPRRQHAGPTSN